MLRDGTVTLALTAMLLAPTAMGGPLDAGPPPAEADAESDGIEVSFLFPERRNERIVVRGLVSVPPDVARTYVAGADRAYSFDLAVTFRRGETEDSSSVRYDPPASAAESGRIPLVFDRLLDPGTWELDIVLKDLPGGKIWRLHSELEVPEIAYDSEDYDDRWLVTAGFDALGEAAFRIRPMPRRLLTGRVRLEVDSNHEEVSAVAFVLNGRERMRKSRPPFGVELDLGSTPRLHRFTAIGYDADGDEVARDEITLNAGPHRLAVRLVEPQPMRSRDAVVPFAAEVELPDGERLQALDIFVNDERHARLEAPPFRGEIEIDSDLETAYVRAVARLPDGRTAEDLVFLDRRVTSERMDVHFVELFSTVIDRKGRLVDDLVAEDFSVIEDGVPQVIRRFERVRDRAIDVGILVDASGSMATRIDDAETAAKDFLEKVLKPDDRAAVVLFNDEPYLRVPLCNDPGTLSAGLTDIKTGGETALYDGLIRTLYEFSGLRTRSVIVLLTDGADHASEHSFEDALEFARRVGAAIYTIGIDLDPRDNTIQSQLRKLAEATGGRYFSIHQGYELSRTYERIAEELHSEYVLGYQSDAGTGDRFRRVHIEVAAAQRPGLRARSIPGYYP